MALPKIVKIDPRAIAPEASIRLAKLAEFTMPFSGISGPPFCSTRGGSEPADGSESNVLARGIGRDRYSV